MILRFNPKRALTFTFVALGPLGNILTPYYFPDSFRTYYFLLPLFPLYFTHIPIRMGKIAVFFLPLLLYCSISAFIVENFGTPNEPFPLFRLFLLICQFFFVIGAAASLKTKDEIAPLLKTYMSFYFISLAIGFVFFIGYYLNLIPLSFISRFTVLTQFGFTFLRFSPGSYPNEYGIVSSFILSLIILLFLDQKLREFRFRKITLSLLFFFTFVAFLLTTTRAAYLSFLASLIYLAWKSGYFFKVVAYLSLFMTSLFGLLLVFKFNMFEIISMGFTQRIDQGSLGDRFFLWLDTLEKAADHPYWGAGFASLTNIHNVYLQLALELGLMGTIIFLGTLFITAIEAYFRYERPPPDPFLTKVKMVGLINILSFAASNHNMNHHLTWFVCFLAFSSFVIHRNRHFVRMSSQR